MHALQTRRRRDTIDKQKSCAIEGDLHGKQQTTTKGCIPPDLPKADRGAPRCDEGDGGIHKKFRIEKGRGIFHLPKAGREIIPSTAAGADGRAGAWQGPDRGMRCIYPPRSKENGSGKADRKPGRMSNWTFGPGVDRAVLYRHCTGIAGFCDQNADHAGIYHFQRFDPGLCLGAEPYAEPTYLWFFGEKAEGCAALGPLCCLQ